MKFRIHRLAVAEIDHEVDYYESRQLGPQWKDRIDRRVAVLDRFPFTLPYQIVDDDVIVVLALAHTSRKPGYWSRR